MSDNIPQDDELFWALLFGCRPGGRPLLNPADGAKVKMAVKFYETAKEVFNDEANDVVAVEESVMTFEERVDSACCNMQTISHLFAHNSRAKKDFLQKYLRFRSIRQETIRELKEIAVSIQEDAKNANVAKAVGSLTGAAGAGALLLSAPVAIPAAMTVAGAAIVLGAGCSEMGRLKASMDGAKKLIGRDRLATEGMGFVSGSEVLAEHIDRLVGFSVLAKICQDVEKFLADYKETKEKHKIEVKFRRVVAAGALEMKAHGKIQAGFGVNLAPVVATFVFVACVMSPRNRFVFEGLVVTHHLCLGLVSVFGAAVHMGRLVAALVVGGDAALALPQAVARRWGVGTFAAVGLVVDVANTVVALADLYNGSESAQARDLQVVAHELEKELSFLQVAYEKLAADQLPKELRVAVAHREFENGLLFLEEEEAVPLQVIPRTPRKRNVLQKVCRKLKFLRILTKKSQKKISYDEIVCRKCA